MNYLSSSLQSKFPELYASVPTKQQVFETFYVRDYRILLALLLSLVACALLLVFDVRYWWTYEKSRRQIILLPAQTERQDRGCGCGEEEPTRQRPGNNEEDQVEELFLSTAPSARPPSAHRSGRRRRPHHPFAVNTHSNNNTWNEQ